MRDARNIAPLPLTDLAAMTRRRLWRSAKTCTVARVLGVVAFAIAASAPVQAAQVVDYPQLGVRFTVPAGWTGREIDGGPSASSRRCRACR